MVVQVDPFLFDVSISTVKLKKSSRLSKDLPSLQKLSLKMLFWKNPFLLSHKDLFSVNESLGDSIRFTRKG